MKACRMRGRNASRWRSGTQRAGTLLGDRPLNAPGSTPKPWSEWPLVRGLVVLYETLVVAARWLLTNGEPAGERRGP